MQTNLNYNFFKRSFSANLFSFFIFASISFSLESFIIWMFSKTENLMHSKWIISKPYLAFYALYFFTLAFTLSSLWKKYSSKILRLVTAFFSIISLLSILWNYTFLIKHDYFISQIASLFIFFSSIILNILTWKKDIISAITCSFSGLLFICLEHVNFYHKVLKEKIL